MISRDLLKWIGRFADYFDVRDLSIGSAVFQEALDCFTAYLSQPDKRMPLAQAIAARLNVTIPKVS